MKTLSFGSFPLVHLDKRDRQCIDSYMIKNFAKLLVMSATMGNTTNGARKYRTPSVILNALKGNHTTGNRILPNEDTMNDNIRAFQAFKEIYNAIGKDPFYRDNIVYPIYIEQKSESINASHGLNINYDYDFLLLTNDLQKHQSLDELTYNDDTTLSFLLLKDLLYPLTKLQNFERMDRKEIEDKRDLRMNFVKFLEHSKSKKMDPIIVFEKIIQSVGKTLSTNRLDRTSIDRNTLLNKFVDTLHSSTSKETNDRFNTNFRNMFNKDGQLMSASKLINLTFTQIGDFTTEPEDSLDGYNDNYLKRQFNFTKTQEFTSTLQVLDSLLEFNSLTIADAYKDANTISNKIDLKTEEGTFTVDMDSFYNNLNSIYFPDFIKDVSDQIQAQFDFINKFDPSSMKNYDVNNVNGNARTNKLWLNEKNQLQATLDLLNEYIAYSNDPHSNKPGLIIMHHDAIKKQYTPGFNDNERYSGVMLNGFNKLFIEDSLFNFHATNDYSDLYNKITSTVPSKSMLLKDANVFIDNLTNGNNLTKMVNYLQQAISNLDNNINNSIAAFNATTINNTVNAVNSTNTNINLLDFQKAFSFIHADIVNFTNKQNGELFASFIQNNKSLLQNVNEFITMEHSNPKLQDNDLFKTCEMSLKELVVELVYYIKTKITNSNLSQEALNTIDKFFKNFEVSVYNIFDKRITKKIIKDYNSMNETNFVKSNDNIINQNPILKKIISDQNGLSNLKTFILTEQVLIDFYDITYYFDSLKYKHGIIKNIVQRLNNKENKINRALIRLGLDNCPVFIIGNSNNIYLKMPDFLSLTNSSFFQQIRKEDLKNSCRLKGLYNMWDEKAMYDYISTFKRTNIVPSNAFRGNSGNLNSLATVRAEIDKLQKINQNTNDKKIRERNKNLINKYNAQIKKHDEIMNQNRHTNSMINRSVNNPLNHLNNLNRLNGTIDQNNNTNNGNTGYNNNNNANNANNANNGYNNNQRFNRFNNFNLRNN